MQDVFIEYLVKRQPSAKSFAIKALSVVGGVLISVAAFLFSGLLGPFSIIGPLLAMAALYGAYFLITSQNVEYEYSITNGELDVDQIVAQRKRKRLVTVNFRNVEAFGRYKPEAHQGKTYYKRLMLCDHPANPELWYCVARLQGGTTLLVFNANQKMLDGIKPFLPRPIMHEAFRVGG